MGWRAEGISPFFRVLIRHLKLFNQPAFATCLELGFLDWEKYTSFTSDLLSQVEITKVEIL